MRVIQFNDSKGGRHVGLVEADGDHAVTLEGFKSLYDAARLALAAKKPLAKVIADAATGMRVDYARLLEEGRVLAPLDHPEPARFLITGTGITSTLR